VKRRIVLDTNILISGIGWSGLPKDIIEAFLKGEFILLISRPLLSELERVLNYKKFYFIPDYLKKSLIGSLLKAAEFVEIEKKLDIIKDDPEDNRVLECAISGKADYIVTGDEHLLKLYKFNDIKILTPIEFLKEMS